MTMHPNPERDRLSTRTLSVFFMVGLALTAVGVADFDDGKLFVLVGAVVMAFNGKVLLSRWLGQIH
ncbi:hypothetical protein [Aeromicrobium sp. 9AM]|uniref:hypothetical protein n=1 Tax=Aeromicrobium sp. 9AM TaxID=2653126 RepID=UPI0012F326E9|nr:hypothetical protein [Aeromicrobium sp. 9AM]VXB44297.1 hypothetical protein AERO9AM_130001 [Aeromicrobium sp. 9AM]